MKSYLKWEDMDMTWDNLNYTWDEIIIVERVLRHGSVSDYIKGNPWAQMAKQFGEKDTEKFVKIFCRVNDMEYTKVIKPNSNIKIKAKHFEKTFNDVLKISIKF